MSYTMHKMKVQKQYSNTYVIYFGYNGMQFGETRRQMEEKTFRSSKWRAHDEFIKEMKRYTSEPYANSIDCKIEVLKMSYAIEDSGYANVRAEVKVSWLSTKGE